MATPVYPIQSYAGEPFRLPYPVRDSYNSSYARPYKRTDMDDGQGRNRRKWEAQPTSKKFSWLMTWNEFAWFEAFLKYECSGGAGEFYMPFAPGMPLELIQLMAYPSVTFNESANNWLLTGDAQIIRPKPVGYVGTGLPVWPSSLPEPEKTGYAIDRENQFAKPNIQDGYGENRRRFQADVATYTANWFFEPEQWAIFDAFVHDQLYGGLGWFLAPFSNGLGATVLRAQFVEAPKTTPQGRCFIVSGRLITSVVPMVSAIDYFAHAGSSILEEVLIFSDSVSFALSLGALQEVVTFSDHVSILLNKVILEDLTFEGSISTSGTGYRTTEETLALSDVVSYNLQLGAIADSYAMSASGGVAWNDYIDGDYIEDDYIGTTSTF